MRIKVVKECTSTNDLAWQELSNLGQFGPIVIVAEKQTAGRGRMGRVWESESAGNLYTSALLTPPVNTAHMGLVPIWAGMSLFYTLSEFFTHLPPLRLKWPNDLVGADDEAHKFAGILAESRFNGGTCTGVVVGLGLNITHAPQPADGKKTAALCVAGAIPKENAAGDLPSRVALRWASKLQEFITQAPDAHLLEQRLAEWDTLAQLKKFPTLVTHTENNVLKKFQAIKLLPSGALLALDPSTNTTHTLDQAP